MEKEWKVEVKLTVKDIFFFLMRHSFSAWQGKLTWALGLLALIGAPIVVLTLRDNFTAIIFLIVAFIYLVVTPLSLYSNAQRQMVSNSVFKNKIVFTLKEEMFQIRQYTGEAQLFWSQLEKIDISRRFYLLYVNAKQAFILPKRFIESTDTEAVAKLLKEKQEAIEREKQKKENSESAAAKNKKKKDRKSKNLVDKALPSEKVKSFKLRNDALPTESAKDKENERKKKNGSNRNKNKQ